jgi:hypothetical protein
VSSEAAAPPAPLTATAARLRRLRDALLGVRTAYVLGALLLAQWIGVLALALTVRHNGWLYYAGGDQIWHYSGAYLLAHGDLPPTYVSYGWSFLLLPIAPFAGPNLVSALPAMVLLNTLVLLPVALLCVYGIAARIAGRLFGYWAAALWIAVPYLGIVFLEPGYHQKYTELTLPQLLGLTSVPDFPSVVALLVGAYFCLRALDSASWYPAAAAGLATGYSIAIKPSNSIFLVAPVLTLLVLRWRALIPFTVALAPALLTLALWKYRGLGELAAAPPDAVRLAGADDLLRRIHNAGELNSWEHLHQVLLALREHFWISRVMEWLPVGGAVALLARSRRGFVLVVSWFAVYLLTKGTYIPASVEDASFWRILMPAFPAFVLLAASVVLLVPGLRTRPEGGAFRLTDRKRSFAFAAAVAVFVVAPLGVVAAVPPLHDSGRKAVRQGDSLLPLSPAIAPRATLEGDGVRLSWRGQPAGATRVFYRILRTQAQGAAFCAGRPEDAADDCRIYMEAPAATHAITFLDRPGLGAWTYRIGVSANWLDDFRYGDIYTLSEPVTVTVR